MRNIEIRRFRLIYTELYGNHYRVIRNYKINKLYINQTYIKIAFLKYQVVIIIVNKQNFIIEMAMFM